MNKHNHQYEVFPDKTALAQAACNHFIALANQALDERNVFSVALAGGSTPRAMYSLLSEKYAAQIDWTRVHIFWGDERCVPPDHKDSNYRMTRESLLDHVPIPADNVHRMQAELSSEEAAAAYEVSLQSFFDMTASKSKDSTPSAFDLLLLGIGTDGHTASLFPGTPAMEENRRWVVPVPHTEPPPPLITRISLTLPAINAARQVTFLASGSGKATILNEVLSTKPSAPHALPAARVKPSAGQLLWLLDAAAASKL
jgi:6-phosphogluconolactonase